MEQFDSEKARRVWQRVQAGNAAPAPERGAETLAAREAAESGVYLRLSRQVRGQDSQTLRRIAMQDKAHGEILRGVCRMTTGMQPPRMPPVQDSGTVGRRLQLCYGRKLQMAAEYESRISDPQFGSVFRSLAEQEQAHCRILLAMIGKYGHL